MLTHIPSAAEVLAETHEVDIALVNPRKQGDHYWEILRADLEPLDVFKPHIPPAMEKALSVLAREDRAARKEERSLERAAARGVDAAAPAVNAAAQAGTAAAPAGMAAARAVHAAAQAVDTPALPTRNTHAHAARTHTRTAPPHGLHADGALSTPPCVVPRRQSPARRSSSSSDDDDARASPAAPGRPKSVGTQRASPTQAELNRWRQQSLQLGGWRTTPTPPVSPPSRTEDSPGEDVQGQGLPANATADEKLWEQWGSAELFQRKEPDDLVSEAEQLRRRLKLGQVRSWERPDNKVWAEAARRLVNQSDLSGELTKGSIYSFDEWLRLIVTKRHWPALQCQYHTA